MTVRGWRAWYRDWRKFSSLDTSPDNLPREGLQIVMLYLDPPPYREVLLGADYIVWTGETFISTMERPSEGIVFPGSYMEDWEFNRLQIDAFNAIEL